MALKIKYKKLFRRKCILDNFILPENINHRGLYVDKESGSGIFQDPDSGDPKRHDPTESGSVTLDTGEKKQGKNQLEILGMGKKIHNRTECLLNYPIH